MQWLWVEGTMVSVGILAAERSDCFVSSILDYSFKNIDPDLWRRFKAMCALRGMTIRKMLLILITTELRQWEQDKYGKG